MIPVVLVDALCHLELCSSPEVAALAGKAAAGLGTGAVICAGTDPRHDEHVPPMPLVVHRAYGIHPHNADASVLPQQLEALERRLDGAHVVALGECGMDLRAGQPAADVQEQTLRAQLDVARRRGLPLVLHIVRAHARVLSVLEDFTRQGPLPAGGVWHAFAGPAEAVDRALRLGLSFSVGGLVLNQGARRLRSALPKIPAERLLVETDAPHAALSSLATHIAALAALRGVSPDELARTTAAAARAAYRLPS